MGDDGKYNTIAKWTGYKSLSVFLWFDQNWHRNPPTTPHFSPILHIFQKNLRRKKEKKQIRAYLI